LRDFAHPDRDHPGKRDFALVRHSKAVSRCPGEFFHHNLFELIVSEAADHSMPSWG
jgi:hypothetical protein